MHPQMILMPIESNPSIHTNMNANFFPLLLVSGILASTVLADTSSFVYDLNNRVTQVSYADGRQAAFTYDELGNILSISIDDESAPSVLVEKPLLLTVGSEMPDYSITLSRPSVVLSYAAKGLPKGLKANLTSKANKEGKNPGTLYGVPTKEGNYQVQLSAKTIEGKTTPVILMVQVTNPFALIKNGFALAGQYSGILPDSVLTGGLGGTWTIKVTSTGSFSGNLIIGSQKFGFSGSFDGVTGLASSIIITRKSPLTSLTLSLALDVSIESAGRGNMTGSITDGISTDVFNGSRQIWSKNLPAFVYAEQKGSMYHTAFFIETAHLLDEAYPQGVSYTVIKVDRLGKATIKGKLAEATAFTASTYVLADGQLPLFIPLYKGKGSLIGTLNFETGFSEEIVSDNAVTGSLNWLRPALPSLLYSDGFITQLDASGGVYLPPAKGSRILDLGSDPNHSPIQLILSEGGLEDSVYADLTISTANKIMDITPNAHAIKLSLNASTGLFLGQFNEGTRKAKMEGIILPANEHNESEAYGFFVLPGATSATATKSGVSFIGPP